MRYRHLPTCPMLFITALALLPGCGRSPDAAINERQTELQAIEFEHRRIDAEKERRRGELNAELIEIGDNSELRRERLQQYLDSEQLYAELEREHRHALDEAKQRVRQRMDEIEAATTSYRWIWLGVAVPAGQERTMPWRDVLADPEIRRLSGKEQELARQEYFRGVVAPRVPTDHLNAVRIAFDRDTKR